MNESDLFDQFLDALRRNPKAVPPPGLDAETAAFIRALVAAEGKATPPQSAADRVWHKALTLAESEIYRQNGHASAGKIEQHIVIHKADESIGPEGSADFTYESAADMPNAPVTRPPTSRWLWQHTLTLAASVAVIVALGVLLIEMVNNPRDGYPALMSLTTPEATPECISSSDSMVEGETRLEAGDYAGAAIAYACAIELDPTNYAAYLWRGALAAVQGDYDQLGYDLHTIFSHRLPGTDPTKVNAVKGLPALTRALTARPDDSTLYLLRGVASFVGDLRSNALDDFDQLIALEPDNPVGYALRWPLKSEANIIDDPDIQQAQALTPDSALIDWVVSLDLTEATASSWLANYDRAIELHPQHPFAYEGRGIAHIFAGDMAAAAADFYQHIQINGQEMVEQGQAKPGESLTFETIPGTAYRVTFEASMWRKLDVVAIRGGYAAISRAYPPTQVILNPAGEVMPVTYNVVSALGASTTPILNFEAPADGLYTLVVLVNSGGPVTITISETE